MNIKNHRLIDAEQYETPFVGEHEIKPKYICLYRMQGQPQAVIDMFLHYDWVKESTHVVIDHMGICHQLAPFNAKTWHAGASYYQGHHGLNGFAIGIHLVSADDFITTLQEAALINIIPDIVAHYNIRDIVSIKRPHTSLVDLSGIKQYTQYGNADSEGRFVATANVMIYEGPHPHFRSMDELKAGEAVKVLRYTDDGQWAFVLYERKDHIPRYGWTHESFLKRL